MNVIIIVVDALRPDHLSENGYKRETSPNIDKFSKEGTSFSNVYTVLPNSNPTFVSLLTGMYPHNHGVRLLFNDHLKPNMPTLAEILKNHGYETGFIRSGSTPRDGSERGFDDYDTLFWKIKNKLKRGIYKALHPNNFMGVAEQRFTTAIEWIKKNSGKKFFLLMHCNDLHWPYPVPNPFQHMFDPNYKGKHDFANLAEASIGRGELIFGHKKLPIEEIEHAIAHYDGGIRYVDTHFGRLMQFLKAENLDEETLVVLTADHGENFFNHGFYFQHGEHLYQDVVRIPLMLRSPKIIPKNKKIAGMAQIIDIMPTVLDLLDIHIVENLDGHSMLSLIEGKSSKIREFAFAESVENYWKGHKKMYFEGIKGKWRTMIADNWKIIYIPHPENDIFELYDLNKDPDELHNLIGKEKKVADEMKKKLLDFLKPQSNEGKADVSTLTEKSKKLLIKAGYLE